MAWPQGVCSGIMDKRIHVPLTNIRNRVPFRKASDGGGGAMAEIGSGSAPGSAPRAPRKRADARRNEQTLLEAAAAAFLASGVDAPVRDIAAKAGVGIATIYRHFPTRADLIGAVYRHQVEACAEAGPALLATGGSPHAALARWVDLFVDFLVTKHGLAEALQSDDAAFVTLHAYFIDRLVPVCAELLDAAAGAGEIRPDVEALELMHGVGNLCIGAGKDPRYDARRMVAVLLAGLRLG
jgi:AcrR family transcriptional regulator